MKTKHTSGPWLLIKYPIDDEGNEDTAFYIDGKKQHGPSESICHIVRQCRCVEAISEQQANAGLISAAPDLLEALQRILELYVPTKDVNSVAAAARAAIAKATGESQ